VKKKEEISSVVRMRSLFLFDRKFLSNKKALCLEAHCGAVGFYYKCGLSRECCRLPCSISEGRFYERAGRFSGGLGFYKVN